MATWFCRLFLCFLALPLFCQPPSSNPQVGTVTGVTLHKEAQNNSEAVTQYDVSLKVGDVVYVVLYTPPSGSNGAEYSVGMNVVVQVKNQSIKFTKLGRTSDVPILRRENHPTTTGLDWSRAPSEYFTQKLRNLSEQLDLTPDQQAKAKPILEQEAGEAGQIISSPVVSAEDKLNNLERIVRVSDQKLKPLLSVDQWEALQDMRKDQKRRLRESLAEKTNDQE